MVVVFLISHLQTLLPIIFTTVDNHSQLLATKLMTAEKHGYTLTL